MKKKFKLKLFALAMMVMAGLTIVPSIYAAQPFQNHDGVTEENADFVVSYTADKTELQKGEEFTVTISVDKLPENGKGIVSLSSRIAYDSNVLEPLKCGITEDENGNEIPDENGTEYFYIVPGTLGKKLNFEIGYAGLISVPEEPSNIKALSFGTAKTMKNPTEPGVFATIKFRAKTDATESDAKLMLLQDGITYNGFAIAGKKYDGQRWVTDPNNTFFIKSNLSNVKISNI